MIQLDRSDRRALLALARRSVEAAVCGHREASPPADMSPRLREPAAAFVTLHERGELRGCIGLLRFDLPLWVNVVDAAAAAALRDPRFMPVQERELPSLELEVSVLDPPEEISDPAEFVAGKHGIVVERGFNRGLLLPQVATEMGWSSEQMLDAVCRKAGLPVEAWRRQGTSLSIFESICFDEASLLRLPGEPEPTA